MIYERTHYYAKAGQREQVLAIRRQACEVRVGIGLSAGTIRVKSEGSNEGPDVIWECAYASKEEHRADLAARAASTDFEAVRKRMGAAIDRFERLFEERVSGSAGWAGDIDVATLRHAPVEHEFASGELRLKGYLWQPPGAGPFPCMIYNHGSGLAEGHEDNGAPAVPILLNSWGIAVFLPHRRGYGFSPGPHWRAECPAPEFSDEYNAQLVHRLGAESDDVLAALVHLRSLPAIDGKRIGVMGSSFGGVNTLLAASRESSFRCAVEFAGAAMNWDRNPTIVAHLLEAARKLQLPTFFIQAENDFSTRPTTEIAQALAGSKLAHESKIYPPFGHTPWEGHFLAGRGTQVWGSEVRRFLERHL